MATVANQDQIIATSAHVTAPLTFMVKTGERPYVETEALTGKAEPVYHAQMETREVPIYNARPAAAGLSLEREGVELHQQPTRAKDLYDDAQVRADYYPEVEAAVMAATGAGRVVIFDHTRRRDDGGHGGAKAPASRIHNDYTEWSGKQRVIDVLGAEEAARLEGVAYAQVNLWRPIRGPVKRSPLALLDAGSVAHGDLIATDMVYPDRAGEIYHLAYNPDQRWLYFPELTRDEAILIKGYDSRTDGRARFTPHAAFVDPNTRADDPPRESIEVRTLALFE